MATKVQTRIRLGQCIDCGAQLGRPGDTTRRCAKDAKEHSRKQSARQNPQRAEHKSKNKCVYCSDPPKEDDTCCEFHSLRRRLNQKEYTARQAGRPAPSRRDVVSDVVSGNDSARRS